MIPLFDRVLSGEANLANGTLPEVDIHPYDLVDVNGAATHTEGSAPCQRDADTLSQMLARSLGTTLLTAGLLALASPAAAQPEDPRVHHVTPPPAPDTLDPELLVAVGLGAIVPLEHTDICPGDSLCVLGAGGAFNVEIERRWPFGLGLTVGYDAWFVDSGGVFEIGVVQIVHAGLRFTFATDEIVHPSVSIGAGALVFGDTFLPSTLGGAAQASAGAEVELTGSVALLAGAQLWLFTTSPFTTGRDRTMRSEGLGLNVTLQLNLGLSILADSGAH